MLRLGFDIEITKKNGTKYKVMAVDSINIKKDINNLADTATITLPQFVINKQYNITDIIQEGDAISISLGYEETGIEKEFVGFINKIQDKSNLWQIECEDAIFLFKKELENKEYKDITLEDLLKEVCKQVNSSFKVDSKFKYTYDKFIFNDATGVKVLQAVQKDTKANIYFKDDTLYIRPAYPEYGEKSKVVIFDYSTNIQASNLTIKKASDQNVYVEITYKDKNGKEKKEHLGTTGGDKKDFIGLSSSEEENKTLTKNIYDSLVYDGYEGDFTAWLVPRVEPEESVEIRDPFNPNRKGIYYVSAPAFKVKPYMYKIVKIEYNPKYLFSDPAEFDLTQELRAMDDESISDVNNLFGINNKKGRK